MPSGSHLWLCDCGWVQGYGWLWVALFVMATGIAHWFDSKEIKPVDLKGNQPWILIGKTGCWNWNSSILVIWYKEFTQQKSPWCWERLRVEWEEGIRGWDGWTASPIQWRWTWANSGRWWGTGRPGVLPSMGSQRVGHDWVTELILITDYPLWISLVRSLIVERGE